MQQRLAACALTATLVAACASPGGATNTRGANPAADTAAGAAPTGTPAQQESLARYEAYAGPPLQYFTWLGHYDSWQPLGKDRLVIYTSPSEPWLLRISPPCDLRFVNTIGISSTSNTVFARFDSVLVRSSPGGPPLPCAIEEIRKVDYARMRADMRAHPTR